MTDLSTQHKAGDSYARLLTIPTEFADGYFVGWTPKSQIRTPEGALVAECTCTWLDAATTRHLQLVVVNTSAWPVGQTVQTDVQFTRTSDGFVLSTTTATLRVVRDVTSTAA
jgi:hypothetical protein